MPLVVGIVLPAILLAVGIRAASARVFKQTSRTRRFVDRYALWAILPLTVLWLLLVAWPLAVVLLLVIAVAGPAVRRSVDLPYGTPRSATSRHEAGKTDDPPPP